jgi:hypothetical protein
MSLKTVRRALGFFFFFFLCVCLVGNGAYFVSLRASTHQKRGAMEEIGLGYMGEASYMIYLSYILQ